MALPMYGQGRTSHPVNHSGKRRDADPMDIESDLISSNTKAKVGLLSHTLVPSPIIQWILPARLRGKHQNDVVFVGERSLQIKEAVSGVHLEGVTSKSDFDAYIMAAKVINVSTELPWEAQMKLGASSATATTTSKEENDLPPQILLLSLASKELVFLYYSNAHGQFIHHHRPLPNDVSAFERFGRNIAVEPRSRAVAVSASCDYFGVFMLKKPPILQSQMLQNQLDPIAEERFFRVDGDIIFMEFLYPKSDDGGKVILLLLVAQEHTTHAICYEWDANEPLRQASPRVTKKLLPVEDRLPTMLIPLTKTSSFMLITTTSMAVYRSRLDPRRPPSRYPLPAPDRESHRSPLWTRWARPLRNWIYNQKHDDIYLCREDGRIFYLGIGNDGEVETQTHLGQLCCDVDAAFDILDIGHEGGDLLLAAGNTGDGGLFVQKARDHPRCVQKFMNWTPVTDSVLVKSSNRGPSEVDVAGDRLFVCSASSFARGAIVELRHGIEAQIGLAVSLEELAGTRDIWTMLDGANGGVHVLISDPVSSVLLYLSANFGEDICAVDEVDCGLDFGAQTLAAGCTAPGVVIQVTNQAIHLGATAESVSSFRFHYDAGQSIAIAAVDEQSSLIAVAVRAHYETHLHLKRLITAANQPQLSDVGYSLKIPYEPVCISIGSFEAASFVFIGTGNGKILVYHVEEDSVKFLVEKSVDVGDVDDISKAIDSITTVSAAPEGLRKENHLLCGLRSGILVSFGLAFDSQNATSPIVLQQTSSQRLGHTPVRVQSRGRLALLTCGQGFWQASCIQEGGKPDCTLQKIWITDQNNPAYHPKNLYGFSIANIVNSDIDALSDTLFCIADGQLLICTLDHDAKTVPRRIDLPGSATKLAYSHYLKSLIVAYTQTEYDTESDPIRRFTRPRIEFVDPDSQHAVLDPLEAYAEDQSVPWRPQGSAGEKISCILEWTPRKGDEEYHFIVIGTSRKNQPDQGRVIFLQTVRDFSATSRIECHVKHIHKFEQPVYSIAPYGGFTLMVSTGHEIVPLEPKISDSRGIRAARFPVLSPALSMTIQEPYIYMSTARESLMILRVSDDKLALHAHDRQKLDGLSHVHIGGEQNLILASSRGGRVSILRENGVTESYKMMPVALCEAHLPSSVSKLSSGTKPSPVSSHSQVFYGTAMNGTVHRFLTLAENEWRLLRLLQNLCVRDPVICPFTPRRTRLRSPVGNDPLEFQPSQMHIDGDILSRLVMRGPDCLARMLATGDFHTLSTPEAGSPQAIRDRFSELCRDVLGEEEEEEETGEKKGGKEEVDWLNAVERVMGWLQRCLHVEL